MSVVVIDAEELARIVEGAVRRALEDRDSAPAASGAAAGEWLDRVEAAELLGVHVDTVRRHHAHAVRRPEGLPVHRVGRRLRYRRSELEAWMRAGGLRGAAVL